MKKLIIVLGMHRSGTSVVTQICQRMGAYLGESDELMSATTYNPDGYFENKEICGMNEEILHLCGREWYSLGVSEVDYNSLQILKVMDKLKEYVQKLFEKSDIVAIKDPRISILLPLWNKLLETLEVEVHYIWVFRNPLEVAESLRKRDGYSTRHGLLLWAYYNLSILKSLKNKKYLLVNYRNVLENRHVVEELGQLIGEEFKRNRDCRLEQIVKKGYCHSDYSDQMVLDMKNEQFSQLYGALLKKKEQEIIVSDFEKCYVKGITDAEKLYLDYEAQESIKCLEGKELFIYGAGNYGKQAAEMLQELGISKYNFCDRDRNKQGTSLMGGQVFSIREIEEKENLCVIIAVEKRTIRREIEQTLSCIKGVCFLSFFALKAVWKYSTNYDNELISKAKAYSSWHKELIYRWDYIMNAYKCPVLVYQNGKVGSSTVCHSLNAAGTETAHMHRFFFKNDMVGELLFGKDGRDFIESSDHFQFQTPEFVKYIKDEMKGKKIITMVRDPIAVDLSTVFEWIGTGITDRYVAAQLRQGKVFHKIVSELMVMIQDRLFQWFDEELKELCGVDIFAYPFDREKGYSIIMENGVQILLMKAEKLSQMTEVIREFTGNHQLELINQNEGKDKEYAHIYKEVKKRLEISREYVEHYYNNNFHMDHFYSEEEKAKFMMRWKRYIK